MTDQALLTTDATPVVGAVDVEVVVPVFNEERVLQASVLRLHRYLSGHFPLTWLITVADNASTDRTWGLACRLARELPGVRAVHLDGKGRGRALRAVWSASDAAVVAYMDVDLSTDLAALLPLVAPLISGHSDLAIGSRLARGAHVVRGPRRELISRSYNLILRATFRNGFSDAQCGFKAVRTGVARDLLPLVQDDGWFFDTELLVLAEHNGLRIHEVPVDWVDDPDSRVDVVGTARDDLRGVLRVLRSFAAGRGLLGTGAAWGGGSDHRPGAPGQDRGLTGQIISFAGIGGVSTLTFALLFSLLFGPLGAAPADVVALALCGAANLAANRRFTFSARGRADRLRHYRIGSVVALLPVAATIGALGLAGAAGVGGLPANLAVVTGANLAATAGRFLLLRRWVFGKGVGG